MRQFCDNSLQLDGFRCRLIYRNHAAINSMEHTWCLVLPDVTPNVINVRMQGCRDMSFSSTAPPEIYDQQNGMAALSWAPPFIRRKNSPFSLL